MNDNTNNPTKKRKASDGRATADGTHDVHTGNTNDGGGYFSGQREGASASGPPSPTENNTSQLDRMEQIMMRMEEKLATVSSTVDSLESRCEQLEKKCSSLENKFESTSLSTKEHMNRLETKVDTVHVKLDRSLNFHEYNERIVKNQSWEYSAADDTTDELIDSGYTEDEANHVVYTAREVRKMTKQMRRGLFPEGSNQFDSEAEGISMEMPDDDPIFSEAANEELLPHWMEFAAALKQFTPAMTLLPDTCESYFAFYYVQLNHEAMLLIKEALIGKAFQQLSFMSNNTGEGDPAGMTSDAIIDVVESNKHLRKLDIVGNRISNQHIEKLCYAVYNHPLVELDLSKCFEPGIGDKMLTALLTSGVLMLEKLEMSSNNITSAVSTLLADFLATNPRLKELNLVDNRLNDSDAALIGNALRSNTTLRHLHLDADDITNVGEESLRLVLYDESSLNSAADSNHICILEAIDYNNSHPQGQINRGWKLYSLLSIRNQLMSNVKHFGDIDVKILPNMLEAMQRYHNAVSVYNANAHSFRRNFEVEPVSIVYETLRKWDKVMQLCKSLGAENMSIND
eukprot:scaffold5475_cov98-Skeletonema_marinoi.AAC.3